MPKSDNTSRAPFVWDAETPNLAVVKKSDVTEYRFGYARKGKREYVTMRYWYFDELDNVWKPTKNGMNIDLEQAHDFVEAIIEAATWANEHGGLQT